MSKKTLFRKKSRFLRLMRRSPDWIMMPPYPFGALFERVKRENNWLIQNYHRIEWFDGNVNTKYFTIQLRNITHRARYIYSRGQEKVHYLSNLLSRNVYNLEGISPAFKNLPDFEECGQRCTHQILNQC